MLTAPCLLTSGWGATYMSGAAEIYYDKYDAEVSGKEVLSGYSFAQKYSVAYTATNLRSRLDKNYYDLKLGYDWVGFNTTATTPDREVKLDQSFGKLNYRGAIGYSFTEIPLRARAYVNDTMQTTLMYDVNLDRLIDTGFIYSIEGATSKNVSSGFSLDFDPNKSWNATLQGLPRILIAYDETNFKNQLVYNRQDIRKSEFTVSLNSGTNWINYRKNEYENRLDTTDRITNQKLQIGHIDNLGQRQWALLTNWIDLSVDGSLLHSNTPNVTTNREEYDVNIIAIATRRTWSARTFMNYNRLVTGTETTESASIPVYVKGLYGSDSDWYVSLNTTKGRQQQLFAKNSDPSYSNSITAGMTTFKRSSFTLSPSIALSTTKQYDGTDSYSIASSLETASTRRFSDTVGLAGQISWRAMDNGSGNADSTSWSSFLNLKGTYTPNSKFIYGLEERTEIGSGAGYLAAYSSRSDYYYQADSGVGTYLRNYFAATASWTPSAPFSASLAGSYDYIAATDLPASREATIAFRAGYDVRSFTTRVNSVYKRKDNGIDPGSYDWVSSLDIQYRPDRYSDGLFKLSHDIEKNDAQATNTNRTEILQRYNYNFFTRAGVLRNIATISEEYYYASADSYGSNSDNYRLNSNYYNLISNTDVNQLQKNSSQYLKFSGRYNPTERLSLYGSVKYDKSYTGVTMYYNAGLSAQYNMLNGSIDYTFARRDSDKREERRLTTNLSRTF